MSNTKHTPGPWKILKKSYNDPVYYIGQSLKLEGNSFIKAYSKDNANLVAAAPDLLAVLEGFTVEDLEWNAEVISNFYDVALRAITKAKGGTE